MIFLKNLYAESEEAIGMSEVTALNEKAPAKAHASMGDQLFGLLPLICIFVIFYLFILRPQSKKMKDRGKMLENLQIGDKVKTSGGIVAQIKKIEEDGSFLAEIAPSVEVKFLKDAVLGKI